MQCLIRFSNILFAVDSQPNLIFSEITSLVQQSLGVFVASSLLISRIYSLCRVFFEYSRWPRLKTDLPSIDTIRLTPVSLSYAKTFNSPVEILFLSIFLQRDWGIIIWLSSPLSSFESKNFSYSYITNILFSTKVDLIL